MKKLAVLISAMVMVFAMGFGSVALFPPDAQAAECLYEDRHEVETPEVCVCKNHDMGFVIEVYWGFTYDNFDCGLLYTYCSACPPPTKPVEDKGEGYEPHEYPIPDRGPHVP